MTAIAWSNTIVPSPAYKQDKNPGRSIAISLIAGVVFAGGFYAYLRSEIDASMEQAKASIPSEPLWRKEAETRRDGAVASAGAIVEHIGAGRTEAAYALMASLYRAAVPLAAFQATCASSRFLSTARKLEIQRTREQLIAGPPSARTLRAEGVLISQVGAVDATGSFVEEQGRYALLTLSLAGVPVLQAQAVAQDAGPQAK